MIFIMKYKKLLTGLSACVFITISAIFLANIEFIFLGFTWIDSIILSILLGTAIHTIWKIPPCWLPGVQFAAKWPLEIAIVLLGASTSITAIVDAGLAMVGAVMTVVVMTLSAGYGIGRMLGLPRRVAILVACGNAICGNSAIAAAAPVIGAKGEEVTASITFTAALGIPVVVLLPLTFPLLHLTQWQYGVIAGMVLYAVPQVLAATIPIGQASAEIGILVKLIRVLMLGPVIACLGLMRGRAGGQAGARAVPVPWCVIGFAVLMTARSLNLVPEALLSPLSHLSSGLTNLSMAALGLSVNLRTVLSSGGRVLAAGGLSLITLAVLSATAVALLSAP